MLTNSLPKIRYSLDMIQEEVRCFLQKGKVSCHQPLYILCQCFPLRDWDLIVNELEQSGFLLRDRISELVPQQEWAND
jgi:hypothetical protein